MPGSMAVHTASDLFVCWMSQTRTLLSLLSGAFGLSSIARQGGFANAAIYVACKHAVGGLTESAAPEGAVYGVRVNAVAPGPVQTEMLEHLVGGNLDGKASVQG